MTKDEWNELATALEQSWRASGDAPETVSTEGRTAASQSEVSTADQLADPTAGASSHVLPSEATRTSAVAGDSVEQIVQRVVQTVTQTQLREAENQRPPSQSSGGRSSSSSASTSSSSTASDVLKTVGLVSGVGPIVTGLLKLFGGGDSGNDSTAAPDPVKFQLPSAMRVEAGLTTSRSLSELSYAQNDRVRAEELRSGDANGQETLSSTSLSDPASAPAPAAGAGHTIQIQVNAMDSKSFIDHSDDIAQAVRVALLRSHALNDVMSEI